MYIAIAADGKSLESMVSDDFSSCKYLLIVNMDNMKIDAIENTGVPKGIALAHKVVDYNCEAVITGKLTPEAFDIIADGNVTRYNGRGYPVQEALSQMNPNMLKLIKNIAGTDDCVIEHNEESCSGHDND